MNCDGFIGKKMFFKSKGGIIKRKCVKDKANEARRTKIIAKRGRRFNGGV